MNINSFSKKAQELLTCIDTFIEQQSNIEQPPTIKRSELEAYIEAEAERLSFPIEKNSDSIKSYYTFYLEDQEVLAEILYRYSSYYTRHSIGQAE